MNEMKNQPDALLLAHLLELDKWPDAAAELRRLHAENQELKEQMAAIGAGGVEPLRKTSADTSALRAALEEAEAALEVATSRLFARSANYRVYVTSEACALEIVRKALGKSQADHFRGVTKMMPPERACTRSHPHEKQSAVCDLQEVTDWLRHFAAGGLSISVEKATQYAAQVERVAKALKAPAILDADEIVALAAQLATGAIDNLADQLNGQVKVAQLCKDAIEQIRARVDAANAQLHHQRGAARHWRKRFYSVKKSAKATVRQLKEELHEECRLLGASAEKELALRARVQELEAKAKVRLSIPPVQLPEPDINTANHAGVRVLGYTAHKVGELLAASAAHRARADDEKAKLQHYRTALEAIAAPVVSDAQIKAVFLANGFTIKEGLTDLKPYVYQAARALLATGGQAQAVERIAIDMKQTAELLDLFGGEPTEFTVMQCNGPSGPGLYAYVTEYPEDGASYLGKTDCDAQPAPQAQAVKLLAADHSGMKVDYRGLFSQVQRALKRTDPFHAEMLRQLEGHLQELGQRWYAGDTAVVDELLQLYSVECQARDAIAAQAKQGGA